MPAQRSASAGSARSRCSWRLPPGTVVTEFAIVPEVLLPGPGEVFATFIDILRNGYRETTLWQNGAATLWRCGAGFVLACLTGVPLGLAMGHSGKIRAACNYLVQFMRPLPPLSYVILLILWLGTGDTSKIALLYLTAFPIIASSAMAGVGAPSCSASRRRARSARRNGRSSATSSSPPPCRWSSPAGASRLPPRSPPSSPPS